MSSQKQSHRVRKYERWHENIVKENEELKRKVAYFERRPPVYRVFQYMKWKREALLVRVQDEHYNQRLEEQYECTGGWKVSDPKTRPFKFSSEMEDWEYHG